MKINTLFSLVIFVVFSSAELSAQWNSDPSLNTPVCTQTGKQSDLRMLGDGNRGSFIAWKDYRAGVPDIYIQYLDADGIPLWDVDGVPLCSDFNDQSTPAITSDMAGGAIVAWSDWRSGIERDIYAQRINASGVVQWTFDGVGVATKDVREHNEKIISDEAGGAIIVWEQQTFGQWDIWAQRINQNGVALWTPGGVPVCTVDANRLNPKIQGDGKGGAIITWQDYRSFDYNIYAQRMSPLGNRLWGNGGIGVCTAAESQINPKIDPDSLSGGAYITWVDRRNGVNYDIYAQRLDSTGAFLWPGNGMPVCTAVGNQAAQDMLSNSSTDGIIVTWKDQRSGNYDIYAQKLSPVGFPVWLTNGVPVCTSNGPQLNPNIVKNDFGGAIITWQDSSGVDWNVKAQNIDANGAPVWQLNGVNIGTATDEQTSPKNVSDGIGGSIFAFQDKRSGTNDIYAHHLYSNGTTVSNVGVNKLLSATEQICYPNPFTDEFKLQLSEDPNLRLRVIDLLGAEIPFRISDQKNATMTEYTLTFDPDHTTGIYLLEITSKNEVKTLKVIRD